jgi:hypothetical protein
MAGKITNIQKNGVTREAFGAGQNVLEGHFKRF